MGTCGIRYLKRLRQHGAKCTPANLALSNPIAVNNTNKKSPISHVGDY